MNVDSDQLGSPDTDYNARVTLPTPDFVLIVKDLPRPGESGRIDVSQEGIRSPSDEEGARRTR